MTVLLDTNVCVAIMRGRSRRVLAHLECLTAGAVAVCSVVKAELFVGCMKSSRPEHSWRRVQEFLAPYSSLPFDDECAAIYARLRSSLEAAGRSIGTFDLLIAAIALAHDATLVTHNVREFSRVEGLKIEDWESS